MDRPPRDDRPRKFERPKEPRPAPLEREAGERVVAAIRAAVEAAAFEVVSARTFSNFQVRLLIDGPGGAAVTVADCERASRTAIEAVRGLGLDPGSFEFEVASPGADRPLTRPVDFVRFRGQAVTVTLREPREGRRNFTGPLLARSDAGDVTVHVLDEPEPETFGAAGIKEVRLHPDPREGRPTRPDAGRPGRPDAKH